MTICIDLCLCGLQSHAKARLAISLITCWRLAICPVRAFECFKECLWAGNNTGQCMSCSVQFRGPVPSLSFATTSSPTVKRNSNGVVVAAVQSHKQHAARNVWAKSIKAPEPGWNLEQLEDMSYWVPSTKSTAAATNCNEYVGLRQGFSRSFLVIA